VAQLTTGSPVDENLEEDEAAGTIAGNEEQREKVPQDHLEGDLVKAATDPTSEHACPFSLPILPLPRPIYSVDFTPCFHGCPDYGIHFLHAPRTFK